MKTQTINLNFSLHFLKAKTLILYWFLDQTSYHDNDGQIPTIKNLFCLETHALKKYAISIHTPIKKTYLIVGCKVLPYPSLEECPSEEWSAI